MTTTNRVPQVVVPVLFVVLCAAPIASCFALVNAHPVQRCVEQLAPYFQAVYERYIPHL